MKQVLLYISEVIIDIGFRIGFKYRTDDEIIAYVNFIKELRKAIK